MSKTIEKELRAEIYRALQNVTNENSPRLHAILQTAKGYQQIETKIIHRMVTEQMTPSACIPHIEREY